MKREIFEKNLHHQFLAFESILRDVSRLEKCDTDVIMYFIENLIANKNSKFENRNDIENIYLLLEKLTNRIKLANEKLEIKLDDLQAEEINSLRNNEKQFSTTTAGIYLSEKLNRKKTYSRAQINNFINDNKISSKKNGNKNIIYQSDLDRFIERYKDTLRK